MTTHSSGSGSAQAQPQTATAAVETEQSFWNLLAKKVFGESVCEGVAKGLVALAILAAIGVRGCVQPPEADRPGFVIPLMEVVAARGNMTSEAKWVWGDLQLVPDPNQANRMTFRGHPDGEVFIIFRTESMELPSADPSDRFFDVFYGTHKARTATGYLRFVRNFQVLYIFDDTRKESDPIWFYGDMKAFDADGNMAILK